MSTDGCRRFSIGLVRLMCNGLRVGGGLLPPTPMYNTEENTLRSYVAGWTPHTVCKIFVPFFLCFSRLDLSENLA